MSDPGTPNGRPQDERSELAALRQECERLRQEVAELREDRRCLLQVLGEESSKGLADLDYDALLEEARTQPPFSDVVAELLRKGP